jgi:hypothetical protein
LKTDKNILQCKEFDESISSLERGVGDATHFVDGGKDHSADWVEEEEFNAEFNEEFRKVVNDEKVPEADAAFTCKIYDDTCLNMELALPRRWRSQVCTSCQVTTRQGRTTNWVGK